MNNPGSAATSHRAPWLEFFDVNGYLGWPARGQAEFPTTGRFLAHLDRLGVSRALISHLSARDVHPTWGNRELAASLSQEPAGAARLIPAFAAGATTLHEKQGLAELRSLWKLHPHGVLRLFPRSLKHDLEQIEPLLEAVQDLVPLVLVDREELPAARDLAALAGHFPKLVFICTRVSWGSLAEAYDLLSRQANVVLDLSWLHTCGTIEDIVERFGSKRLVFGLGPKSNAGASLAALCDAQISSADREAIASRTLSDLLRLPPAAESNPPDQRRWSRFVQTGKVGVNIFDAHGHLGPFNTWMLPVQQLQPQIEDISRRMARLEIRTMIVSGTHALFGECLAGNHLLEEAAGKLENFQGYLVFNPHHAESLLPHFDSFFSRGFFVGFKLLSSYWNVAVTDRRYQPVWEYAHRFRLPILLHTWEDNYDLPMMLDEIAGKYDGAIFLLGHSGGTDAGRASALELAQRHSNVYLEWCGSYRMTLPYEELITALGSDRIIFGTDAALHSPAWELGRFLSLDLPDEMLLPALGANMRRILALRRS